jgi:hypothetical protein
MACIELKSQMFRWEGYEECMGEKQQHTDLRFWRGMVKERCHLKDPGADGRIILKWIFKKEEGMAWSGFVWLGTLAPWA